jgi:uncharacterized DUF497 family protein
VEKLEFEWDPEKARSNLRKHGVGFPEATTVLRDRVARMQDERVVDGELREVMVGASEVGRLLVVVFVDRGRIRIISARRATPFEQYAYEEAGA